MPDFVSYRPSERKSSERAKKLVRRRSGSLVVKKQTAKVIPASGETNRIRSSNGGERPLAIFRKLLQDFHSGVSALRGLSKSSQGAGLTLSSELHHAPSLQPASNSAQRSSGLQSSEQVPKSSAGTTFKTSRRMHPLVKFKASLGSMREALPAAALRAVALPPSSLSQKAVTGTYSTSPSRARAGYHTKTLGADREAQSQILSGEYTGSVHHLPSAARLAQILRTESLIRAGEAQPSGIVFALAQAIREGRRREVADLNPEIVQDAMTASLGGPTRAKQLLNSPITHRLITRHQIAVEALQRDIRSIDPQRARAGSSSSKPRVDASHARGKWASRAPEFTAASPALISAAAHASPSSGMSRSHLSAGMGTEANLREMMTVNETPHLNEVAMDERERLQSSGTRSEFSPRARQAPPTSRSLSYSPIGESGTRSSIAATIDAPKTQPRMHSQAKDRAEGGNHQQSQRQQRLKGTLQLRGHNNQLLGIVELQDGEITNG